MRTEKEVIKNIVSSVLVMGSLFYLLISAPTITGASVVMTNIVGSRQFMLALFLILISIVLLALGEPPTLEERVKAHWKKFRSNILPRLEDLEQGYLSRRAKKGKRTALQEKIEQAVTSGQLIEDEPTNKKSSYERQFYEGHAAQGGRVIDVFSHIARQGKHKGKLIHFGQPANARYLWVIDEEGNFVLGNRQIMHHEMPYLEKERIDYAHRLHKLPHATLARGKKVYGAGEVLIEGGQVKWFTSTSGHYVRYKNIPEFDWQCQEVFKHYLKKAGWKEVAEGAQYIKPRH